jgi:hypothetical protein
MISGLASPLIVPGPFPAGDLAAALIYRIEQRFPGTYFGVITDCEPWPGTVNVLEPLPLFVMVPPTGDPGTMTPCDEPAVPLTIPGPREVVTAPGVPLDAPKGATWAKEVPIVTAKTTAVPSPILIMSHPPAHQSASGHRARSHGPIWEAKAGAGRPETTQGAGGKPDPDTRLSPPACILTGANRPR